MGYLWDRSVVSVWANCWLSQLFDKSTGNDYRSLEWYGLEEMKYFTVQLHTVHCQKKMILYIEHNQHSADEKHKLNYSCSKLKRFFLKTEKSQYLAWDGISGTNLNSVEWSQLFAFNFDTLCWNSVIVVPGLPPLSMMGQIHFCFRSTVAWMRVLYFVKGFK